MKKIRKENLKKCGWSQVTITPSIYILRAKTRFLSFDCFNWCREQVLWLGWTLILNSFPICPQSLLSLISDDISRTELGKGQISIKIVCRIFFKLYRIQMNFISGIGGRRMGSHSAGKFMMTEYQSSLAEGLWSYPAPELRILVSC